MKCLKCQRDFPSIYHFQAPGVCNDCYEKMSADHP
jgi:predicted amidophosphoribosyltransferase